MPAPTCSQCKRNFDVARLLGTLRGYSTLTDSGTAPCPNCGVELEFRVRPGTLEMGYTYWAGSFHFAPVESFAVSHLRVTRHPLGFEIDGTVVRAPSEP